MTHFLSKLFDIRTNEWPRFLLIFLMYFVELTGFLWADAIIEAAFLRQVGVEYLPLAIMANAVCSVIGIFIYSAFADRIANDRLLIAISAVSAFGIGISLILLGWGLETIAYPLLYMIVNVPLRDVFNVHWPIYVMGFYNTRAAKRIFPALVSGARLAGIVAGGTMPILNRFFSPAGIIGLWLTTVAAMALLAWLIPRILKDQPKPVEDRLTTLSFRPALTNIREGFRYISQSRFLHWMALSTFSTMVLLAFINYQAGRVLLAELKTIESISNFTGLLNSVSNLILLPFQLFLLNRMIGRMGLGHAAMIFPTTTTASCAGLMLAPGLFTAGLGLLSRSTLRTALYLPIDGLLYNAIPLRVKARARAFVNGWVVPVGSLAGGMLLLIPLNFQTVPHWLVPAVIGVLALTYLVLVSAWGVRRNYSKALVAMLEQEDFSYLSSREVSDLTVTDSLTLNRLEEKLLSSSDSTPEFKIFMAQLISQAGGNQAVLILARAARATSDARIRSAIIDVLVASDVREDTARELFTEFLADPDCRVRQSAFNGLEQLSDPSNKPFQILALDMLRDGEIDVRTMALLALAGRDHFTELPDAIQMLNQLLIDPDPQLRERGVGVLGQICITGKDIGDLERLLEYLADPSDEVRLKAALAFEQSSESTDPLLLNPLIMEFASARMKSVLQDPVERIRQAAVTVIGRIATVEPKHLPVSALTDSSPQVRETAVDVLVRIGRPVSPVILAELDSPDLHLRKMAAVVLSRISPAEYGSGVANCINSNLSSIYTNCMQMESLASLAGYSGISVLRSALQEKNRRLLDEIFYFLGAVHSPSAVKIINESLRSEDQHTRANAVEALDALVTYQASRLITPFFDQDMPPGRIFSLGKEVWGIEPCSAARTIHLLVSQPEDPWLRTMATYALGEMGATLRQQEKPDAPGSEKKASDRSAPMRDRLSLLHNLTGKMSDTNDSEERKVSRGPLPKIDPFATQTSSDAPISATPPARAEGKAAPSTAPLGVHFSLMEVEKMLEDSLADPVEEVRLAAQSAHRMLSTNSVLSVTTEKALLSIIEKVIFLKEVPFFQGMSIEQLRALAGVCEEEFFAADSHIYNWGDPGGALFMVVSGKVGIEQEKRKGSFARVATIEVRSYFGETDFFNDCPHTSTAIAIQDTLTLRLRREPLIALARRHPDMSLELINVLSKRLREANERIAELTRTRPRELQKLFDKFD